MWVCLQPSSVRFVGANGRIIITPATLPGVRHGFLERVDHFIDNYRPALETLAQE